MTSVSRADRIGSQMCLKSSNNDRSGLPGGPDQRPNTLPFIYSCLRTVPEDEGAHFSYDIRTLTPCDPLLVLLAHSGLAENDREQNRNRTRSGLQRHGCRPFQVCGDGLHQDNVSQGRNSASQLHQNECRDVPGGWHQAGKDPGQTGPARHKLGQGNIQAGSSVRDQRRTVPATETLQIKCSVGHHQKLVAWIESEQRIEKNPFSAAMTLLSGLP